MEYFQIIYTQNKINNTYITCDYKKFCEKEKLLNIPIFDDIHCVEIVKYDKIMKYSWKL